MPTPATARSSWTARASIVTALGYRLEPGITRFPPNATEISIAREGKVTVTLAGDSANVQVGQIELMRFVNKAGLQAIGDNLFLETPASGTPQNGNPSTDGFGDLQQGNLEMSNVETVDETLRPDRRAARLRDERQGHHRGRPDAAVHLADAALRRAMMRFAVSFLFLALAAAPWAAPAAAQSYAQPRLKAQVVAAGDIVRVGDMIENAGLAADKPIFRAPDLGQTGAVPARAVLDAVRPFGLIAVDARGIVEVIAVVHQSRVIRRRPTSRRDIVDRADRAPQCRRRNLKIAFDRDVRPIEFTAMANGEVPTGPTRHRPTIRFLAPLRRDLRFGRQCARAEWRYTGAAVETRSRPPVRDGPPARARRRDQGRRHR